MRTGERKPGARLTTICPTCGKEFWYYRSWPRKYCSDGCKGHALVTNLPNFTPTRYTATCQQCGKEYETTPGSNRGRFCSRRCWGQWLSIHGVGDANPVKGRKFGRPKYLPPPVYGTCTICGGEFLTKASHLSRRRTCSRRCAAELKARELSGENSPTWNGGYEPYYGPSWRPARRAVLERDTVCQACGMAQEENGRELDVHHISPFRLFGVDRHSEANQLDNLVALCHDCHLKVEWATNR